MEHEVETGKFSSGRTLKLTVLVLAVLWIVGAIMFLGARPWSSRGEPREALVAQSIVEKGNWILGEGYGGIVPSKPPVLHWSAAGLTKILSPSGELTEFLMRLPSALAALVLLGLTAWLSIKLHPNAPPLIAPLLLATSVEFWTAGTAARVDMVLSAAMFAAVLLLYHLLKKADVFTIFAAALAVAIAVLSKGPIGLALPCGTVGLFWLVEHRSDFKRAFARSLLLFIPALIALGVASLWYYAAYREGGQAFFDKVMYENVLRFLGDQEDKPHYHAAPYLLMMLVVGLLPWSLPYLVSFGKSAFQKRAEVFPSLQSWYREMPELGRLMVWWAVLVTLFFCLPASKRSVYLLPIYPALAVLAVPMATNLSSRWINWILGGLFTAIAVITVLASIVGLEFLGKFLPPQQVQFAQQLIDLIRHASGWWWFALVLLAVAGGGLLLRAKQQSLGRAALWLLLGLGALQGSLLALGAEALTPRRFAQQLTNQVDGQLSAEPFRSARLLSYGYEFYGLSYYLKRRIDRLDNVQPQAGDVVVLFEARLPELEARGLKLKLVDRSRFAVDKPGEHVLAVRVVG